MVEEPTEEEYYRALAGGLARNPEQEKRLRVLAWWRTNDAFRGPWAPVSGIPSTPATRRKNLEVLACLLDEGKADDGLMKAEVLRELGEFESAKQVLERVDSSEVAAAVRQLRALCECRDTLVRELESVAKWPR